MDEGNLSKEYKISNTLGRLKSGLSTKRQTIRELREQGLSIRSIQKELGISSPSVVQYYLNHSETPRQQIEKLAEFIMQNFAMEIKGEGAVDTAISILGQMCLSKEEDKS